MHEQSGTVQDRESGLWYNVFGVGPNKGRPLPPEYPFEGYAYPDAPTADQAADQRSKLGGRPTTFETLLNLLMQRRPQIQ